MESMNVMTLASEISSGLRYRSQIEYALLVAANWLDHQQPDLRLDADVSEDRVISVLLAFLMDMQLDHGLPYRNWCMPVLISNRNVRAYADRLLKAIAALEGLAAQVDDSLLSFELAQVLPRLAGLKKNLLLVYQAAGA